jgi:hypothetical protein
MGNWLNRSAAPVECRDRSVAAQQGIAAMGSAATFPGSPILLGLLVGSALWGAGCPPPSWPDTPQEARRRIDSDRPGERVRATAVLGNHVVADPKGEDLLRLIDRLEDTDAAARLYAITALEQVAGSRLSYQPWAPLAERHAAVRRWRAWYAARAEEGR